MKLSVDHFKRVTEEQEILNLSADKDLDNAQVKELFPSLLNIKLKIGDCFLPSSYCNL